MAYRNLFRLQATDFLEDDGEFLRLFGSDALDIFEPQDMWGRMQIIRSPKGGGKTSVLRIFVPGSLNAIQSNTTDDLVLLRKKLKEIGALSDTDGVLVLGVLISLSSNYEVIEHLGLDEAAQDRLFFALLTSKIMIAALRGACELKEIRFPRDLDQIRVERPNDPNIRACIPIPCDGGTLYEWAMELEGRVYDMLEGQQGSHKDLGGHETLSPIRAIRACNMFYGGEPVAKQTLLMLDNTYNFTVSQRTKLADALASLRMPGIVVSELLESIRQEELLSPNGDQGREYATPVSIGRFWRTRDRRHKFRRLLRSISDKRAAADPHHHRGFRDMLEGRLGSEWDEKFDQAAKLESQRIRNKLGNDSKYENWIKMCESRSGTPSEKAERWKALEIIVERDKKKPQKRLFQDAPIPTHDLYKKMQDVAPVSKFYIRTKYKIPYHFGFNELARLASYNIHQFLYLSSDLFDEMANSSTLGTVQPISPKRQQEIIQAAAENMWAEISRTVKNKRVVMFMDGVAAFCKKITTLPNAPYGGVTGISISYSDLGRLRDQEFLDSDTKYKQLAEVLSTCFARNILEQDPDARQGRPGTKRLVMYINRLYCVKYRLPSEYGGWQKRSLDDLCGLLEGVPSIAPDAKTGVQSDHGEDKVT